MKRFLFDKRPYSWLDYGDFYFHGYFVVDDHCYREKEAVEYLKMRMTTEKVDVVLRELNGVFGFMWERIDTILFAVDRLRGLPLFYAVSDGELLIGDNAAELAYALPHKTISAEAVKQYRASTLFVPGDQTLYKELKQVQGAELCVFDKKTGQITQQTYFTMTHDELFAEDDVDAMLREFHAAYGQVGKNLVAALRGRTAVVPLSGGADSRMVVDMLKREGYERVICFTYGKPGNSESEISRRVAKEYGYPWIFVPNLGKDWSQLRKSPLLKEYMEDYAFAYSSTPHMQDFLAVKKMTENGQIPEDSVFVPGHSGDLIAGSHITSDFLEKSMSKDTFLQEMANKFCEGEAELKLKELFAPYFTSCSPDDMEGWAAQSEWFNIRERQAKFIVNSVRIYEFFGFEWLIPLWDNTLFDYWKHIPISWRYQRKLYFLAVDDSLPSTNDETLGKSAAEQIRKIPFVRSLVRRLTRMKRYISSASNIEHLIPPDIYFKACLGGCSATFTIMQLFANRLLQHLDDKE